MNDSLRIAKTVTIHTDGACKGNPGPGGWGAVLQYGETRRTLKGGELATTNNRMELKAAIEALTELKQRSEEHTSELKSLMRISYDVFCLQKKNITHVHIETLPIYN